MTAAQAAAKRLDHFRTALVFRFARDANAVRKHFAGTVAAIEFAATDHHAVFRTRNAARAIQHVAAQSVQGGASEFVVARAVDLAAAFALFEPQFALRNVQLRASSGIHCVWGAGLLLVNNGLRHFQGPHVLMRSGGTYDRRIGVEMKASRRSGRTIKETSNYSFRCARSG